MDLDLDLALPVDQVDVVVAMRLQLLVSTRCILQLPRHDNHKASHQLLVLLRVHMVHQERLC